MPPTHEVFNQPPALAGYDVAEDPAMLDALRREGAGWAQDGHPGTRPPGRVGPGGRSGAARPTSIRRCCGPMTASATASTRWSSTRPGTS